MKCRPRKNRVLWFSGAVLALSVRAMTCIAQPSVEPGGLIASTSRLPACGDLAADPAFGIVGDSRITRVTAARIMPTDRKVAENSQPTSNIAERLERGAPATVPYCQVDLVYDAGLAGPKDGYDEGQHQSIGIRIGLPLRADDGGVGARWNGKIQNLGSGGCMGYLGSVTQATNHGYVGSTSDGGHGAPWVLFNCDFGVIQSQHKLNVGLIRDFSSEHVIWQTRVTKSLVKIYYGEKEKRTYWTGCSQGGREAVIAAQTIPEEFDGILGGGAALNWMRFQVAQAWSGLIVKDLLKPKGKTLTDEQIAATTRAEVAACDGADGVRDGVLGDPRTCHWSAKHAMCGASGVSAQSCLDADQAYAFDRIRRGPINSAGQLIWYPWEPGTLFSTDTNYLLSDGVMHWAVKDVSFRSADHLYLDQAHLVAARDPAGITYEDMATLASQVGSDLADVDSPALDNAKARGLKLLLWTGTADRNIPSRITINYYRQVAAHFGTSVSNPDLQSWMRVFLYPGVDHCAGGAGPQPGNANDGPLFDALVNWVENGAAPDQIMATEYPPLDSGARLVTDKVEPRPVLGQRPVCPYPRTAVYRGSGDIHRAINFHCAANLETPMVIEQDRLVTHKAENGTGRRPAFYSSF